jgi:mono/diheme cytochrome c family protein
MQRTTIRRGKKASARPLRRAVLALGICVTLHTLACTAPDPPLLMPGGELAAWSGLFQRHCNDCHGWSGAGDGWHGSLLYRPPRNFREESFHFVSSVGSEGATLDDPLEFIQPGCLTGHPPSSPELTEDELRGLVDYVREIHRIGTAERLTQLFIEEEEDFTDEEVQEIANERTAPGIPFEVPARGKDYRTIDLWGAALYAELCASCHGDEGRGDGPQAPSLVDDLGRPSWPRNLSRGEFRGGRNDRDLFLRIRLGVPGTAMAAIGPQSATDEEVWQLIDHLRTLVRRD